MNPTRRGPALQAERDEYSDLLNVGDIITISNVPWLPLAQQFFITDVVEGRIGLELCVSTLQDPTQW